MDQISGCEYDYKLLHTLYLVLNGGPDGITDN